MLFLYIFLSFLSPSVCLSVCLQGMLKSTLVATAASFYYSFPQFLNSSFSFSCSPLISKTRAGEASSFQFTYSARAAYAPLSFSLSRPSFSLPPPGYINDVSVGVACCVFISDSLSLILCFSAAAHLTPTTTTSLCRLLVLWLRERAPTAPPLRHSPSQCPWQTGEAGRRTRLACARAQKQITVQEHVLISSNLKRDAIFGLLRRPNTLRIRNTYT